MVEDKINLQNLNFEELNGVVSIYPWYGGARMELCRRMAELGEGAWSDERYADAALYIGSRRILADIVRKGNTVDCSDKNISELLKTNFEAGEEKEEKPKMVLVGGDYFNQAQYENVRKASDNIFSTFAQKAREEGYEDVEPEAVADFCTETLAEIYIEQGYTEQAAEIYSKLSLRYPEKSVYFAALIEKIKEQ